VRTNTDFFQQRDYFESLADRIVYTGAIDEYFGYSLGKLDWRTIRFEEQRLDIPSFQGNAVINYTEAEVPFTRIIEHKHFEFGTQPFTVISREYSSEWTGDAEPFYTVNDDRNNRLAAQYKELAAHEPRIIFGGRLAEYKYYDMDQVIASALAAADKSLNK
jgi:UDP-galactopyranose mutase